MEWIMDSGASKHMMENTSLFTSYDNHKHSSQKVSIGDGKQIDIIGFGNVQVTNGQLEDVFHVQNMPINCWITERRGESVIEKYNYF
jgi:hypothetical protein